MAKAKTEQKRWEIEVIRNSYCEVTREASGEYSRDDTYTSHSVEGLRLLEEGVAKSWHYETVEVLFKPVKGKIYHLLYAIYSTGDSFGHDDHARFEVIGVYRDRKIAEDNEKRLRAGNKHDLVNLQVEGISKVQKYCRPWDGYFEHLDVLEVQSFILN